MTFHPNMLNYDDLMSRHTDGRPLACTDTQMLLYNLSVGMGLDFGDERELPKPEMTSIEAGEFMWSRPLAAVEPA